MAKPKLQKAPVTSRKVGRAETEPQKHLGLFAVGLALAVIASFSPAIGNQFVNFDDAAYLTANTHVQSGLSLENLRWAFTATVASNWHPLTWISHMIDCDVYGLRPWGHHLTSLLLHAANTILVFIFLNRFTGSLWRSFFVAGLFGLHPLRVESVAWAAERKDVLSTFFLLLTLLAYGRYACSAATKARVRNYCLALSLFTLGLMSKPMLVSVPLALFLIDFWPLQRLQATNWKKLLVEKIPFAGMAAVFCALTLKVQNKSTNMVEHLTLLDRVGNALVSYIRYLAKTFWPAHLSVFYPHPGTWPAGYCVGSLAVLTALSIWAFRWRKRIPALATGWYWFLVTLVPVIGIVQVGRQSIADRYTYIPSIGLFAALIWLADVMLSQWHQSRRLLKIAGKTCLVLCGVLTFRQTGYWTNGETLFRHAIKDTRGNYLAQI